MKPHWVAICEKKEEEEGQVLAVSRFESRTDNQKERDGKRQRQALEAPITFYSLGTFQGFNVDANITHH